jgi:hypothetical protein
MADLVPVDPSLMASVWPHTRVMVLRAMSGADEGSFERTERELFAGLQQLWLVWNGTAIEAIAVTQLTKINEKKICVIVACSGEGVNEWVPLIAGLEKFAKIEGCKAMRIYGRKGWERLLRDYKAKYVVMDKELE